MAVATAVATVAEVAAVPQVALLAQLQTGSQVDWPLVGDIDSSPTENQQEMETMGDTKRTQSIHTKHTIFRHTNREDDVSGESNQSENPQELGSPYTPTHNRTYHEAIEGI